MKITLPFETRIDAWLKRSHVTLTAKQWMVLITIIPITLFVYGILVHVWIVGAVLAAYFIIDLATYPMRKRKRLARKEV
jgi:uncharacterized ion transporter superfamily protein YfcC